MSKRDRSIFISLDMDETLLCSMRRQDTRFIKKKPEGVIKVFKNGESESFDDYLVYLRPGAVDMLTALQELGELNLFTMGVQDYVEEALRVTKLAKFFPRIFTREDIYANTEQLTPEDLSDWGCPTLKYAIKKDLRMVSSETDRVVGIDDQPGFYPAPYRKNVIPVMAYDPGNPYFDQLLEEPVMKLIPGYVADKMSAYL